MLKTFLNNWCTIFSVYIIFTMIAIPEGTVPYTIAFVMASIISITLILAFIGMGIGYLSFRRINSLFEMVDKDEMSSAIKISTMLDENDINIDNIVDSVTYINTTTSKTLNANALLWHGILLIAAMVALMLNQHYVTQTILSLSYTLSLLIMMLVHENSIKLLKNIEWYVKKKQELQI